MGAGICGKGARGDTSGTTRAGIFGKGARGDTSGTIRAGICGKGARGGEGAQFQFFFDNVPVAPKVNKRFIL